MAHDATLDMENREVNLNNWSRRACPWWPPADKLVTILRWDLRKFAGRPVAGHGLLELTTHSVQRKAAPVKDFGLIRVVEILAAIRRGPAHGHR